MNQFEVTVAPSPADPSYTVFHLEGSLDALNVRGLESHYEDEVAAKQPWWIMDLSHLEYISSAGLGSMVARLSGLREQGGDMILVGPSPKIGKILKLTGFTRIFRIYETERDAVLQ